MIDDKNDRRDKDDNNAKRRKRRVPKIQAESAKPTPIVRRRKRAAQTEPHSHAIEPADVYEFIDFIYDSFDVRSARKIRPFDLRELGYLLDDEKILIPDTAREVRRVVDEYTRMPASFSYMLSRGVNYGWILSKPYSEFLKSAGKKLAKDR